MTNNSAHNPLEGDKPELTLNLHDGSEEMISIIVVHKDKPEYLSICLQSIAVCSSNNNYEIIVVDNNSGKESQEYLDELEKKDIKIIRNDKNGYWSQAANKGVEAANKNSKYFVFMHCDVVVTSRGWLDTLLSISEVRGSGLVGLELGNYHIQGKKFEFVQEWCVLITRKCFDKIGPWPEKLPLIGNAFVMTMRAQIHKMDPQRTRSQIAHHYKIFSINVNEYEQYLESAMSQIPVLIREAQSMQVRQS